MEKNQKICPLRGVELIGEWELNLSFVGKLQKKHRMKKDHMGHPFKNLKIWFIIFINYLILYNQSIKTFFFQSSANNIKANLGINGTHEA